jgi:hypothetical protein
MMIQRPSKAALKAWAKQRRATLIGRSFDLGDEQDMEAFADWVLKIIDETQDLMVDPEVDDREFLEPDFDEEEPMDDRVGSPWSD